MPSLTEMTCRRALSMYENDIQLFRLTHKHCASFFYLCFLVLLSLEITDSKVTVSYTVQISEKSNTFKKKDDKRRRGKFFKLLYDSLEKKLFKRFSWQKGDSMVIKESL